MFLLSIHLIQYFIIFTWELWCRLHHVKYIDKGHLNNRYRQTEIIVFSLWKILYTADKGGNGRVGGEWRVIRNVKIEWRIYFFPFLISQTPIILYYTISWLRPTKALVENWRGDNKNHFYTSLRFFSLPFKSHSSFARLFSQVGYSFLDKSPFVCLFWCFYRVFFYFLQKLIQLKWLPQQLFASNYSLSVSTSNIVKIIERKESQNRLGE